MPIVNLRWCADPSLVFLLVDFFIEHTSVAYISHGEVLDGRAEGPSVWSADLRAVLVEEFSACSFTGEPLSESGVWIAVAEDDTGLLAFAVVEFSARVRSPSARLHDLVVHRSRRNSGVGNKLLDWIEASVSKGGGRWMVLESGLSNHAAHTFFERRGYEPTSCVMMKRLTPKVPR